MAKTSNRSVMQRDFGRLREPKVGRSTFNRSHGWKGTVASGYLNCFLVDEVLPGDTFSLQSTVLARLATPFKPVMDNMYFESFFFFTPYRILQDNFVKMMGQQTNPGDSIDFLTSQVDMAAGILANSLFDQMGILPGVNVAANTSWINAYAFRAYNAIWDYFFRDENLQDSLGYPTDDGPDATSLYSLQRRNKRYDYLTSSLPFPQKGNPVTLPLGGTAPILAGDMTFAAAGPTTGFHIDSVADDAELYGGRIGLDAGPDGAMFSLNAGAATDGFTFNLNPITVASTTTMVADLSSATAATINSLRYAIALQEFLEADARGGTRFSEHIFAHFGVSLPDNQWKPIYLGGSSSPVTFTPVPQTGESGTSPQGNLAAYSTIHGNGHGFRSTSFVEWGVILGLFSIRADLNYQQNLDRMWSRRTRFDFPYPDFAHLGEQAVLNKEIYYTNNDTQNNEVFGYVPRFEECRFKPSLITGEFRSSFATPLDFWHLAQEFGSLPTLNATFIQDFPPVARIIVDDADPEFLVDCYHKYTCTRPLPVAATPHISGRM